MAFSSLCDSTSDDQTKDLKALVDAFCPACTLEEIASAYCNAGLNVSEAGDILFQLQVSKSSAASFEQNDNVDSLQSEEFYNAREEFEDEREEFHHERELKHSSLANAQFKGSKPRKISASVGSISGVLGNKYARPSSSRNVSNALRETAKQTVESLPVPDENITEPVVPESIPIEDERSNKDIEEFLFSMLGEGFNLSKDVIHDVLGQCGYNIKQSADKLMKLSAKTLEKGKAICTEGSGRNSRSTMAARPSEECSLDSVVMPRGYNSDNSNMPNEVLQSLFSFRERFMEGPKKCLAMGLNRTRVLGQKAVTEPLDQVFSSKSISLEQDLNGVVDEDDEYHVLRRAAKQHREAMKVYYEAAIDSFTRSDNGMAKYFAEQGKYYDRKAHEIEAKAYAMIAELRQNNTDDVITLDLQDQSAKEALDLFKLHLHSLADIPSFRCLKVVVGAESNDKKQGKIRQRVIRLMQKESIGWTEDVNDPGTLIIELHQVDQRQLSFAKDVEMD